MADDETPTPDGPDEGADEAEEFKYIVRIAATDLDGKKRVPLALTRIRGVGDRVATVLTDRTGISRHVRIGDLGDDQLEELKVLVEQQLVDHLPEWMINRRKDMATGDDIHLTGPELDQSRRDDLNRLKKIRAYRGVRHERGHKVRGQRTRANGRSGLAMGVSRKDVQQQQED